MRPGPPHGELITVISRVVIHVKSSTNTTLECVNKKRFYRSWYSVESTELKLLVLDCLGFRGRINRDAKESDRFEVELTVPVNLLLFLGASIGSALGTWVEGRKSADGIRGAGKSDSPRGSSTAEELLEEDTSV